MFEVAICRVDGIQLLQIFINERRIYSASLRIRSYALYSVYPQLCFFFIGIRYGFDCNTKKHMKH